MLFKQSILDGIAAGKVTLTFRRWKRVGVKAGGTLRTAAGLLRFESVEPIEPGAITTRDERHAGFAGIDALMHELGPDDERTLYRIAFVRAGDDLRLALRADRRLDGAALLDLRKRLQRYDAAADAAWTNRVLRLIATSPGVRAADLATRLRMDKVALKLNVRKLKELGLTESLEVGYRLSPRGKAYLAKGDQLQ